MNEINSDNNKNQTITTTTFDHKRNSSSMSKTVEDDTTNINVESSIKSRHKRKSSLINSDTIHATTKKLDTVKSYEFPINKSNSNQNNNINHNFDQG